METYLLSVFREIENPPADHQGRQGGTRQANRAVARRGLHARPCRWLAWGLGTPTVNQGFGCRYVGWAVAEAACGIRRSGAASLPRLQARQIGIRQEGAVGDPGQQGFSDSV